LILELRAVKEHVWKQSAKFEDTGTARQHIKLNSSMLAFDIHSDYHHVDIYEPPVNGLLHLINLVKLYLQN
jgi:hypothetical protein